LYEYTSNKKRSGPEMRSM